MNDKEIKRYLVFMGEFYYPVGGWYDFYEDFAKIEDAEKRAKEQVNNNPDLEWCHIVDTFTKKIVRKWRL